MPMDADVPLPPTFDPGFYRAANPDLDLADEAAAMRHYEEDGRREGRAGSPLARREGLVAWIDAARPTLEIGPFCQPLVRGEAVRYLDKLDAAALRARATALGMDPGGCPERIDYVGGLDEIEAESFDAVVASHSIEHQPDLVRHLEGVARALKANGRYYLIVPDKRFCFDHFLAESTVADILDAFEEERAVHTLGSVVEHVALVTHNDPARHWRGDHGGVDDHERRRRAAEAIDTYRRSAGGYLDVHAWQFTPDSFRSGMRTLAGLGLSAFEVEAVYDTPRDRAEFCAVLRRARIPQRSARRRHGLDIVVCQTADPFRYAPMLAVTAPNVIEYCRRHGLAYESFVGIKRGFWPWQASFNRVVMLKEMVERGFAGWAVYLDADAYVRDLDFDLPGYLREHRGCGAIFARSGMSDHAWDVNSGVAMVNCGHAAGRRLVLLWAAAFEAFAEDELKRMPDWRGADDQAMLHAILRDHPDIAAAVHVESMDVLNSAHARFVRQRLRAQFATFDERLQTIGEEVAAVMRQAGVARPGSTTAAGGREVARTLHVLPDAPWLAEAREVRPDPERGARAIAASRAVAAEAGTSFGARLADMIARGDAAAVASEIAALGKSEAGRGTLGGDRQHRRCRDDLAFARQRAARTQDALLSLAELVGAVPIENPDLGPWGVTPRIGAAALFAAVEAALGVDLAPPLSIGGYLGIEVAPATVLHLRMIEAMFAAWRIDQVIGMIGGRRVTEVGGGIGLTAWYARRLGVGDYRLVPPSGAAAAVQAYVLDDGPAADGERRDGPIDLLFCDDVLQGMPGDALAEQLRAARRGGARAILSVGQEAAGRLDVSAPTFAQVAAQAGGWTRRWRGRHGLKPGFVEEIYMLTAGTEPAGRG
jgi:SAM-dependent methyltransferase